ncbi:MAG: UDP-2,3-diacylglucosamine diphosphatase [Ferruginibacter sp.]|nr:UDP-2,3-diacylglucosamine diphosphatase [Ferruginibacter sp.]
MPIKKIFFLSDFHLGVPNAADSLVREKKIVRFLEDIRHEASEIFFVGDMFDFWFEYSTVVPKGYVRIFGKLAELTDAGIRIHFFVGNHDMWMRSYFEKEMNIPVYYEPKTFEFSGKKFYVGHGDGLGPSDGGYKFLKKIFRNPLCQWLFGIVPPAIGMGVANYFSQKSRSAAGGEPEKFLGEEKEWLLIYSREILKTEHFDYFIFGHRHLPLNFKLSDTSRYINLGEWINYFSYAVFDGVTVELKYFESDIAVEVPPVKI